MRNRLLNQFGFMLLLGSTLAFAACQRDEDESQTEIAVESAEVNALTDAEFTSVDAMVEDVAAAEPLLNGRVAAPESIPGCATRTFNQETRTLTIDFGTSNCTCLDGMNRRGKIVAIFNGKRGVVSATVTVTLDNYFVNDNQLTGTKVKTYLGGNKVNVKVTGASIATPKGTATWEADRTVERIAGFDTPGIADDVWLITGSASGVNRRGIAYTAVIEQPLKKVLSFGCARNFVSGIITITNQRGATLSLNYDPIGGEPCDKVAEITINGRKRTIQLR